MSQSRLQWVQGVVLVGLFVCSAIYGRLYYKSVEEIGRLHRKQRLDEQTKQKTKMKLAMRSCASLSLRLLSMPCGSLDPLRAVFSVPKLGRFCLEKKSKDMIKSVLRRGKPWEPVMFAYFDRYIKKGTQVLDIGAHIGTHTIAMAQRVGPRGRVHAFEPQVKLYQELLVNLKLNNITNVTTYFAAVGETQRRITMQQPFAANEGGVAIGKGGALVELMPLSQYAFGKVSFMKIDVEGAEFGVLRGAKALLERDHPAILVEIWRNNPKQEKHFVAIKTWMASIGYGEPVGVTGRGPGAKSKSKATPYNYMFLPKKP